MTAPSVSIVIPFYNAATTLAETLTSAVNQHDVNFEIIAVDDGSTDRSLEIARDFEPPITVLTGPNRGVSAARNRGFAGSKGNWIVFLDSDDLLLPGTLKQRLTTADESGVDVVICDWQELVEGQGRTFDGEIRSADIDALRVANNSLRATEVWAPTAALMYRRPLVEKIGGFRSDLPIIQDARFLFDAAFHHGTFIHTPHIGARYRVLPGSLSRRDPGAFWLDVFRNGKQIEALLGTRGQLSEAEREGLAGLYGLAARGLFACGKKDYFEAVALERSQGLPLPLHPRLAEPLARVIGLRGARSIFRLLGR